jgi:hypothetical protein
MTAGKLTPPAEIGSPNKVVENKSHNNPLPQVPARGWRDLAGGPENGWEKQVSQDSTRETPGNEILDHRQGGSYQPEVVGPA